MRYNRESREARARLQLEYSHRECSKLGRSVINTTLAYHPGRRGGRNALIESFLSRSWSVSMYASTVADTDIELTGGGREFCFACPADFSSFWDFIFICLNNWGGRSPLDPALSRAGREKCREEKRKNKSKELIANYVRQKSGFYLEKIKLLVESFLKIFTLPLQIYSFQKPSVRLITEFFLSTINTFFYYCVQLTKNTFFCTL